MSILRKENGKYSYCLLQVGFVSQTFSLMGPGSYSVDFDNVWSSYPRSKERVTALIMCIYRNLPWKPRALSLLINISNIIQKDTCTLMFEVALFTIDKTCKQSKCLLTDEWIKKMCVCVCVYCCCLFTKLSDSFAIPDCRPPGSSVHGISQARTLEWVVISFFRGSPRSTHVSCTGRWILYYWATREAPQKMIQMSL